ncbi:putative E3 ubiquitin ligase complex SCF subunit sconB [Brachionus plicatilis]|uniref:Putative E3 ubiquitin ligase complex SCF subunit sconB n=1 Tax=Brachionus plicatilis TaxID=10195 RepID=A0A3M7T8F4_BRAPC|nr:putative E3 ubiquitin ligase complex SCF subunit sconB [Brachionus plicatilis]
MFFNPPSSSYNKNSSNIQGTTEQTKKDSLDLLFQYIVTKVRHLNAEQALEKLIDSSGFGQIEFLWTILQPLSHRDFFYNGQCEYPGYNFQKLSTPFTRKSKKKRRYTSAHILKKQDALLINKDYQVEDKICVSKKSERSTLVRFQLPKISNVIKSCENDSIENICPESHDKSSIRKTASIWYRLRNLSKEFLIKTSNLSEMGIFKIKSKN